MDSKKTVGIVGGAGYTAGELLRLLLHHPFIEISFIHSNSQAGKAVTSIHTDLLGDTDLQFTGTLGNADIVFLCMGHGESRKFLGANPMAETIVIDLSQDFRLEADREDFLYGLPELNREKIKGAQYIANPGCFATCIILGLLPLAAANALKNPVHISGMTGSTGAGQSLSPTAHFSWRNNNISVYKAFKHQHLAEITESVKALQPDFAEAIHFIPYRGNFTRGILASSYLTSDLTEAAAIKIYEDYYQNHPFTIVSKENPDLKQVVNTNKALVYIEKQDDQLLIITCIDNLLKGASGQAVHNMNLVCGWDESTGLRLKAGAF